MLSPISYFKTIYCGIKISQRILILMLCFYSLVITWYHLKSITSQSSVKSSAALPPSKKSRRYNILCYVPIQPGKLHAAKVINETWGSRCDKLLFYHGGVSTGAEPLAKYANLPIRKIDSVEGYNFLWGKTKAIIKDLVESYSEEYDWFIKADYDTFVVVENLRGFIDGIVAQQVGELDEPLWFGYKLRHKKMPHGYMSGGSGYALNTKALKMLGKMFQQHNGKDYVVYNPLQGRDSLKGCKTEQNEGLEDLELGRCLHALDVRSVPTMDEKGRHTFLPLPLRTLLEGRVDLSHWIWTQSWYPLKLKKDCCSSRLISIHEVTASDMKLLYFMIYNFKIHSNSL